MTLFHCIHAGLIALIAGGLAWRHWALLKIPANNYLKYWLWGCATWVVYYVLKAAGVARVGPSASEGNLLFEFSMNSINTTLLWVAGYALSSKAIARESGMRWLYVGLCFFCAAAAQIVGWIVAMVSSMPLETWALFAAIASSFVAGFVLTSFYHRLRSARLNMSDGMSVLLVWTFFGYIYLQAWYPTLFHRRVPEAVEGVLYGTALLLKLMCTGLVFLLAERGPVPSSVET